MNTLTPSHLTIEVTGGPQCGYACVAGEVDIAGEQKLTDALRQLARAAGMDVDRGNVLAFAASEIITNALVHGGGTALLRIAPTRDAVVVEVRDHGPGFTVTDEQDIPYPGADGRRGLWLARHMCDQITIDSSRHGTTVRLTMRR